MTPADIIQILILFVLTSTLLLTFRKIKYYYEWLRKEKALEYSLSKNKNLQEQRTQLSKIFGNLHNIKTIPYENIEKEIKKNEEVYNIIVALLAHWENLALGIEEDIIDEDVAFEMTAGVLRDYVRAFSEFIEHRRENNNQRAYQYLTNLSARWEIRLNSKYGVDKRSKFPKIKK